jgi:transposase
MGRFVEGYDRSQSLLLPESLDDYVGEDSPVRVIDAFIYALDLVELGFDGMVPAVTGRPAYHPSTMLKIYLYGYLNRIQSSRRLEREAGRNIELMWLTGFQLPTILTPKVAPNSISMRRDKPFHMTIFPGGGSLVRAR